MNALGGAAASIAIGAATAIVIVTVAILPFLTPQWIAFEQSRANAVGWTGYSADELKSATDSILADLVLGPPDFEVTVRDEAVLDERERGHMRDVRTVFVGLWALAAVSAVVLLAAALRGNRVASLRAVRLGAFGLSAAVVVLGAVAFVAFDALFEVFHRIVFPAGSFDFDPATERLVQLFPFQFWQETAVVAGVVIIAVSLGVAALMGRARRPLRGSVESGPAPAPEPSR